MWNSRVYMGKEKGASEMNSPTGVVILVVVAVIIPVILGNLFVSSVVHGSVGAALRSWAIKLGVIVGIAGACHFLKIF
jgi:hypothetical protein